MRKSLMICSAAVALSLSGVAMAQDWELGGMASYAFFKNQSLLSPDGPASAGFKSGPAFGGVLGYNAPNRWIGGEFRYTYQDSPLKVSAAGSEATFGGRSHLVHYDVLIHPPQHRSRLQPFAAVGGGLAVFRGTGDEQAYQPLSNYAILTHTQDLKPLISVGGGIKYQFTPRLFFRAEFRDYITRFPTKVITPIPGNTVGGWLNNFVPMFGLSYVF
jgi:Outer membrane protein beta-barrel domain